MGGVQFLTVEFSLKKKTFLKSTESLKEIPRYVFKVVKESFRWQMAWNPVHGIVRIKRDFGSFIALLPCTLSLPVNWAVSGEIYFVAENNALLWWHFVIYVIYRSPESRRSFVQKQLELSTSIFIMITMVIIIIIIIIIMHLDLYLYLYERKTEKCS